MKHLRAILILGSLTCLVACGQKGDLYFPDHKVSLAQAEKVLLWVES